MRLVSFRFLSVERSVLSTCMLLVNILHLLEFDIVSDYLWWIGTWLVFWRTCGDMSLGLGSLIFLKCGTYSRYISNDVLRCFSYWTSDL